MPDAAPPPVQLDEAMRGLAGSPALPPQLVRLLFAYRKGFGEVARRPDLTDEIIAAGDHRLTHSLALNRSLAHVFRMRLAEHPDPAIRAAVAASGGEAPRELFERLLDDPSPWVAAAAAGNPRLPPAHMHRLITLAGL